VAIQFDLQTTCRGIEDASTLGSAARGDTFAVGLNATDAAQPDNLSDNRAALVRVFVGGKRCPQDSKWGSLGNGFVGWSKPAMTRVPTWK
jgi:hypothetical protein